MSAKEVSNALLGVWSVVEMKLQVNRMLAVAIVATEVNFGMPACGVYITTTPSSKASILNCPRCNRNFAWLRIDVLMLLTLLT
jgi:hypothetical protein